MILIVDAETSDLPKRDLPADDPAQPWIVSVAAMLCSPEGEPQDFFHTRIRSDGRKIKDAAAAVHGISSRAAGRNGVSETAALGMLIGFAAQATAIVGHGIDFDRGMVECALVRLGKDTRIWVRAGLEFICTMKAAAPLCRIPSTHDSGGFRWPSLDAACEIILQEKRREGHHTAWDDCNRTKRLFLALRERKVLEAA